MHNGTAKHRYTMTYKAMVYVSRGKKSLNTIKNNEYRKTSNISRTLAGNKIVDHSDVIGASPVGAAPTTSSFST